MAVQVKGDTMPLVFSHMGRPDGWPAGTIKGQWGEAALAVHRLQCWGDHVFWATATRVIFRKFSSRWWVLRRWSSNSKSWRMPKSGDKTGPLLSQGIDQFSGVLMEIPEFESLGLSGGCAAPAHSLPAIPRILTCTRKQGTFISGYGWSPVRGTITFLFETVNRITGKQGRASNRRSALAGVRYGIYGFLHLRHYWNLIVFDLISFLDVSAFLPAHSGQQICRKPILQGVCLTLPIITLPHRATSFVWFWENQA